MEFYCLGKHGSFIILFIQLASGFQVEAARQISFKEIDSKTGTGHLAPVFSNSLLDLFKDEGVKYTRTPTLAELISFLIQKQTMKFSKGNKKYEVYPLDKVIEVKNSTRKVLGYFSKMTHARNSVILFYRDGDKSTYGPAYNCKIYLEASSNPSFSVEFKENPNNVILNIKTDEFMGFDYEINAGVFFKNKTHKSILQVVLDEQNKSGDKKKLSPNIFKDIIYGRKKRYVLSKGNSATNIERDEIINRDKLKQMADSFKSDLEQSQNANRTAIEDIIKKSLMKDVNRKDARRKRLIDENYRTKIISKHPVLEEEVSLSEKITKVFDLYHNSPGPSPAQEIPQPNKTESLEPGKENNKDKDEDEKQNSPPSNI